MTLSIYTIMKFVSGEETLIQRAENALKFNKLIKVLFDETNGVIRGKVQPRMKKEAYKEVVSKVDFRS